MTYSVCVDVKDILVLNNIGTFGTDIFISMEPSDKSNVLTIYTFGGRDPNPKLRLDYPNVQIRLKGDRNGYTAAEQRMQGIKNLLLGLGPQTMNTNEYVGFWQLGDTIFLKYDETEHPIFVSNWRIAVQPNVSDNRMEL